MTIHSLKLYKLYHTQWVFDDPAKEIWAEAFTSGTDDVIEMIIKKRYGSIEPERHYVMRFSNEDFPGASFIEYQPREGITEEQANKMEIVDSGSYWIYDYENKNHLLWLSNIIDKYFKDDDKLLFFDIVM